MKASTYGNASPRARTKSCSWRSSKGSPGQDIADRTERNNKGDNWVSRTRTIQKAMLNAFSVGVEALGAMIAQLAIPARNPKTNYRSRGIEGAI